MQEIPSNRFTPPHPLKTAVLFLVFNRPNTTEQVFEAIRKAKPPRLYVAADGPRPDKPGEAEKVEQVRRIAMQVDWGCEVKTLFRDKNLGCKYGPSLSIDWFFENEEEGVILEDDCLPNPSFFEYCEYLLHTYRNEKNICHICGNNFGLRYEGKYESHCFGSFAQVWGWATWRDRWQQREINPFYLEQLSSPERWSLNILNKFNTLVHLDKLKDGLDAWDYQWQITILNHNGLVVYPITNLISNIGDGLDATHTMRDDGRIRLATCSWSAPENLPEVSIDKEFDAHYALKMGLTGFRAPLRKLLMQSYKSIHHQVKVLLSKLLLIKQDYAIVVASSGRVGSTMLYEAIARSWVESRCCLLSAYAKNILSQLIKDEAWRLENKEFINGIVYKTHDLCPENVDKLKNVKILYVYGDPLDSVLSVDKIIEKEGDIWLDEHLYHLKGKGVRNDLFKKDILNYEKQMITWKNAKFNNVFILRYADIWNQVEEVSRFLGFKLNIPAKRERVEKNILGLSINQQMFDELRSLYEWENLGTSRKPSTTG